MAEESALNWRMRTLLTIFRSLRTQLPQRLLQLLNSSRCRVFHSKTPRHKAAVSSTKPSASPPEALFFQGQPPSAPTTPMTSASTHSSLSTVSASFSAAATAGHTGHQSLRYQSVPDFDDNNSDSDWSDFEDSAGGAPANLQPSRLFGDAHIPRDAFEKLAVLGEPFQKLGLELIARILQEAGFDLTLASDRCLALLNSQSNAAEHTQEAAERVQADSNLLLVGSCSISWHYHLTAERNAQCFSGSA